MNISMKALKSVSAVAFAAVLAGCGGDRKDEGFRPSLENPDKSNPPKVGAERKLIEMGMDDVVVWVDGSALTRRGFDQAVNYIRFQLRQAPQSVKPQQLEQIYNAHCRSIIDDFVSDQLLVHAARERKPYTMSELKAKIRESREDLAKKARIKPALLAKVYPGGDPELDRRAETMVWRRSQVDLVRPKECSGQEVSNFIASAVSINEGIARTNAMRKAQLAAWRQEIVSGKATFEALADKYSECPFKREGSGGDWGSYRHDYFKEQFHNKEMGDAIFKLQEGEISQVLEDGEGYSLVKFVEYDTRFGSTDGEDRRCSRIFLPKQPELMIPSFKALKNQIMAQVTSDAVEKEVARLKAAATIVYPNGTNLLGVATAKAQSKPAQKAKHEHKATKPQLGPTKKAAAEDAKQRKEAAKKALSDKMKSKDQKKPRPTADLNGYNRTNPQPKATKPPAPKSTFKQQ